MLAGILARPPSRSSPGGTRWGPAAPAAAWLGPGGPTSSAETAEKPCPPPRWPWHVACHTSCPMASTSPEPTPAGPGPREATRPRPGRRVLLAAVVLGAALLAAALAPSALRWLRPSAPSGLLAASGRIEGRITTLTPKTSAWVVALQADEGQAVRQGQLLATLDDDAQRERVRAAQEQVDALTQRMAAANSQLGMVERQVTLQIEQANAAVREAEARLRRARASREQADRDLQRTALLVAKELIAPQEAEHAQVRAEMEAHSV